MTEQYIRDRISYLRTKKGISEYKMSLDLGHSKSYIQSISSGKALPSMSEFIYICEYLGVSPKEFFDSEMEQPQLINELNELIRSMSEDDLKALISVAVQIKKK